MKKSILTFAIALAIFTASFGQVTIPRPEYPRPQFERSEWLNLNGQWSYIFDFGKSGKERGFQKSIGFNDKITVPFCPESKLSGVEHKDFINAMWYQRSIVIPENWTGKNIILHFGAVDFQTEVFIDGQSLGLHWGGMSSFDFDITQYVIPGKTHNLVVYVEDDIRSGIQPAGKQSEGYYSEDVKYTRVTGIWQTVWLEAASGFGIKTCQIVPDFDGERFLVTPAFYNVAIGNTFRVTVKDNNQNVASSVISVANGIPCSVPVKKPKTWSPESPFLYDLLFEVLDAKGKVLDQVRSYAGMRKIHLEGNKLFLNNKQLYLRFVLDQGFYPDGVWTAPTDAALKNDIQLSLNAGFNGASLHQKVFEERFHYWADKMGYLTWGESSNWGASINKSETYRNFVSEWEAIIVRDRNHPSIIAWTPTNETWERDGATDNGMQHNRFLIDIYNLTHNLDLTRPVNDASGNYHQKTDLFTVHTYEQNPDSLKKLLTIRKNGSLYQARDWHKDFEVKYSGQPYIVDEYGGIGLDLGGKKTDCWGYGHSPTTFEEFYTRLEKLTDIILSLDHISGYCYTQLTNVEQEQNGIYNYDRTEKFDMKRIHAIFSKYNNNSSFLSK